MCLKYTRSECYAECVTLICQTFHTKNWFIFIISSYLFTIKSHVKASVKMALEL